MREIKFRIYDEQNKTFIYWDAVNGFPLDRVRSFSLEYIRENTEQFTGLRDKNGKEIYEGDILAGTLGTAGRGASTRREKPFNFQMMWYRDGWNLSAVDRYCSSTYRWYPNADDCTVIGNIHENPELLK